MRAARRLGIPVATGFHTRFDEYLPDYGAAWLQGTALRWMRRFHNQADATLVPTRELQQFLRNDGFERVQLLARAVDSQQFDPSRRDCALRADWGIEGEGFAAIYVGRIASEKNLPLAVRAFRKLQQIRPKARFVWVGDGPAREACARQSGLHLLRRPAWRCIGPSLRQRRSVPVSQPQRNLRQRDAGSDGQRRGDGRFRLRRGPRISAQRPYRRGGGHRRGLYPGRRRAHRRRRPAPAHGHGGGAGDEKLHPDNVVCDFEALLLGISAARGRYVVNAARSCAVTKRAGADAPICGADATRYGASSPLSAAWATACSGTP